MFRNQHHSQDNQAAVIKSAVLAKAVTRLPNGRHEIVVVFSKSTRLEFYWIFQVRNPRSPQRSWKVAGYSMRDGSQAYNDFNSFVSHRAAMRGAEIVSTRMPQKRQLARLQTKAEHESIFTDWAPDPEQSACTDRMFRKNRNGRAGKAAMILWH